MQLFAQPVECCRNCESPVRIPAPKWTLVDWGSNLQQDLGRVAGALASAQVARRLLTARGRDPASSASRVCAPVRAKEKPVKKLYVGNLPFQATEEDVQALFTENGITSGTVTLIRDRFTGQLRGFGFVEINEDGEAEKAVAALNGKDFMGRKIVVNEARPLREGGGGGGGGRGPGGGGG